MKLVFVVGVLLVAHAFGFEAQGRAQHTAKDEQFQKDAARGAFQRGLQAVKREDWNAALLAFENSFLLEPSAKTRINIALVQVELGLLLEAHAHLQAAASSSSLDTRTRSAAGEQAAKLANRIPSVELELHNMLATDQLFVQGVETTLEPHERGVRVNPGKHTFNIVRDGHIVVREEVFVREGSVTRVVLDATLQGPRRESERESKLDRALAVGDAQQEDESTVFEQWWFWTAVGAVVVGGVVAGALIANSTD